MGATVFARYSRGLLAVSALLMLATAAFNRVVDPFQYFGAPRIPGFNEVKSRLRFFEREVKPALVKREQPEAVILGNSIAAIGFEPLHPALTRDGQARSYNFAMAGTPRKEVFCALQYVLANTDAKRIVLGMLAAPMPDEDCRRDLDAMNENRLPEVLVSPQAVLHSIKTLRHQDMRGGQSHTPEGRFLFYRYDPWVERRTRFFFREVLRGKTTCSEDRLRHSLDEPAALLAPDSAVPFDLAGLKRIVDQVSGRDVQLRIVLYPQHVVRAEAEYLCGEEEQRWLAMDRIARYLEAHPPAPPASVELWDFQGYGPPFDEPLGSGVLTYWQDPIHFNPVLGDHMLDTMFGRGERASGSASGFGYRVESTTLAARRAWLAEERSAFLRAHPETWDTLMRLVPEHVQRAPSPPRTP